MSLKMDMVDDVDGVDGSQPSGDSGRAWRKRCRASAVAKALADGSLATALHVASHGRMVLGFVGGGSPTDMGEFRLRGARPLRRDRLPVQEKHDFWAGNSHLFVVIRSHSQLRTGVGGGVLPALVPGAGEFRVTEYRGSGKVGQ